VAGAASWGGAPGPPRTLSSAHRPADQRARYPFDFVPAAVLASTCARSLVLLELCLNWVRSVIFGSLPVRLPGARYLFGFVRVCRFLDSFGVTSELGSFRHFRFSSRPSPGRDAHLASFPCASSLTLCELWLNLGSFRNFRFSSRPSSWNGSSGRRRHVRSVRRHPWRHSPRMGKPAPQPARSSATVTLS
jgi:hypothetical protein